MRAKRNESNFYSRSLKRFPLKQAPPTLKYVYGNFAFVVSDLVCLWIMQKLYLKVRFVQQCSINFSLSYRLGNGRGFDSSPYRDKHPRQGVYANSLATQVYKWVPGSVVMSAVCGCTLLYAKYCTFDLCIVPFITVLCLLWITPAGGLSYHDYGYCVKSIELLLANGRLYTFTNI